MPQPGARRGVGSRGREIVISHTIAAPRSVVFDAWTRADDLARWFTPRPLTTSRCEVDFRPGGTFRVTMRTADGTEYPLDATFREIVPGERVVFTGNIHGENYTETTVTFAEDRGMTTVTVRQTFSFESDATRGALQAWVATLEQLEKHVAGSKR
jgi:uncharacterized protein YndB with AHSA1/START domain